MAGTLETPAIGSPNLTQDPKIKKAIEVLNGLLNSENKIARTSLEASAKPVTWYTPKIIATEESRTNTAFGTLTTADEITGVVVPENGKLVIDYSALVKSSVGGAGRAAIFIGSNQLKRPDTTGTPVVSEASTASTVVGIIGSSSHGLENATAGTNFVTTGEASSELTTDARGSCVVRRLAAGTYAVSVQYRATSGSVTAKERLLQVEVHGY